MPEPQFAQWGVFFRDELYEQRMEAENGPDLGDLSASCLLCTKILLLSHQVGTFVASCSIASLKLLYFVCESMRVCEENGDAYYSRHNVSVAISDLDRLDSDR